MHRRTVSIRDALHREIQNRRGKIMMTTGKDSSYTEMLNDLLEAGVKATSEN